jgi:hypothetical protein
VPDYGAAWPDISADFLFSYGHWGLAMECSDGPLFHSQPVPRRLFLRSLICGGVAAFFSTTGCGTRNGTGSIQSEPLDLTFQENDAFYQQLDQALTAGRQVQIQFNGTERIGRSSRLLTQYLPNYSRGTAFLQQLEAQDDESGRAALSYAFQDDLLAHQEAGEQVAARRIQGRNGEVIGPLVFVLAVVIVLGTAAVTERHVARGGTAALDFRQGLPLIRLTPS